MTNYSQQGLSQVLEAVRSNAYPQAEQILFGFLKKKFKTLLIKKDSLSIRKDAISLNSVNGIFEDNLNQKYFFKFHLEENESQTLEEYYKAELLVNSGYPTEIPILFSHTVGEQILIYKYVSYERLFDVCRRNENADTLEARNILQAQKKLDQLNAKKCIETLCLKNSDDYKNLSLLQLFFWRLVDKHPDGNLSFPGGRYRNFYINQTFSFPNGLEIPYQKLKNLKWVINGLPYEKTLNQAFQEAYRTLSPENNTNSYPACIAHGDAHNGNIWLKPDQTLSYFDPAFADNKIPVLLAEVKSTFHNIFAHPNWLYNAIETRKNIKIRAEVKHGSIYVTHNWELTPLRKAFLNIKQDIFWIPVIRELHYRKWLSENWELYIRCALFCCPTLVMNLRANSGTKQNHHTPETSLLGLAISIMCASAPSSGTDSVKEFFKTISKQLTLK